jgi:hypothetical protein
LIFFSRFERSERAVWRRAATTRTHSPAAVRCRAEEEETPIRVDTEAPPSSSPASAEREKRAKRRSRGKDAEPPQNAKATSKLTALAVLGELVREAPHAHAVDGEHGLRDAREDGLDQALDLCGGCFEGGGWRARKGGREVSCCSLSPLFSSFRTCAAHAAHLGLRDRRRRRRGGRRRRLHGRDHYVSQLALGAARGPAAHRWSRGEEGEGRAGRREGKGQGLSLLSLWLSLSLSLSALRLPLCAGARPASRRVPARARAEH